MYHTILTKIRTRDDVEKLKSEVDALLAAHYHTAPNAFATALKSEVRSWVGSEIEAEMARHETTDEEYLKGLAKKLETVTPLFITLAFEPTDAFISDMAIWAHEQFGDGVLLEITYDPHIIGGCTITYGGVFVDLTLRKKLEGVFERRREEFGKMIKTN